MASSATSEEVAELHGWPFNFRGEIFDANKCTSSGWYRGSNGTENFPSKYGVMIVIEAWGYWLQLGVNHYGTLMYRITDDIDKWPSWKEL